MYFYHAWKDFPDGLSFHYLGCTKDAVWTKAKRGSEVENLKIERLGEDELVDFLSNRSWLSFEGIVENLGYLYKGAVIAFTEIRDER